MVRGVVSWAFPRNIIRGQNKAGPWANGPQNWLQALKINTRRARRTRKFWGDSNTLKSPINEIRQSGPLKDCEGHQINDIKGPNDPWQFLLILTSEYNTMRKRKYYCQRSTRANFILRGTSKSKGNIGNVKHKNYWQVILFLIHRKRRNVPFQWTCNGEDNR